MLRPDFVFFGEAIPPAAHDRAFALAARADLMLVIGTSAVVAPANWLPVLCAQHGGRLIEVNLESTHLAHEYGALSLLGRCEDTMPRLVAALDQA